MFDWTLNCTLGTLLDSRSRYRFVPDTFIWPTYQGEWRQIPSRPHHGHMSAKSWGGPDLVLDYCLTRILALQNEQWWTLLFSKMYLHIQMNSEWCLKSNLLIRLEAIIGTLKSLAWLEHTLFVFCRSSGYIGRPKTLAVSPIFDGKPRLPCCFQLIHYPQGKTAHPKCDVS